MQAGNVETAGKNAGGLVGYMHSYNMINTSYIHNNYEVIENSFAVGQVKGALNVGGLVGNAYRQCTYNHTNQNTYIQIKNSYAIGKIESDGEIGGLVGQLTNTYNGSSVINDSFWVPETTGQEESKAGLRKSIQSLLYKPGYGANWDFETIWTIDEGTTLAYLKNVNKPEQIKEENLIYIDFSIEGEGTENNPYLIKNSTQLQKLNDNLTASYRLEQDINLEGIKWTPIGNSEYKFTGILDGNGFKIKNLNIENEKDYQGLFGDNAGIIKNLTLENVNIKSKNYIGSIAAINENSIIDCKSININIEGLNYIGGLVRK